MWWALFQIAVNPDTKKLYHECLTGSRSNHRRCSVEKGVLKNFAKNQKKTTVSESPFKLNCRPETLLTKRLQHKCFFSVSFAKFFRTSFFIEHLRTTPFLGSKHIYGYNENSGKISEKKSWLKWALPLRKFSHKVFANILYTTRTSINIFEQRAIQTFFKVISYNLFSISEQTYVLALKSQQQMTYLEER